MKNVDIKNIQPTTQTSGDKGKGKEIVVYNQFAVLQEDVEEEEFSQGHNSSSSS